MIGDARVNIVGGCFTAQRHSAKWRAKFTLCRELDHGRWDSPRETNHARSAANARYGEVSFEASRPHNRSRRRHAAQPRRIRPLSFVAAAAAAPAYMSPPDTANVEFITEWFRNQGLRCACASGVLRSCRPVLFHTARRKVHSKERFSAGIAYCRYQARNVTVCPRDFRLTAMSGRHFTPCVLPLPCMCVCK